MKKLLATSALAIFAVSGAASAQSVLERVLGQIDNATNLASVNGTFANIAENIGGDDVGYADANGVIISDDTYNALLVAETDDNIATAIAGATGVGTAAGSYGAGFEWNTAGGATFTTEAEALAAMRADAASDAVTTLTGLYNPVVIPGGGIDGSINNTLDGIDAATQEAVASATVSATEWNMPTVDLGDMATTALGAVNTGDITLGVNSAVDEASTSTTNAVSAVMNQLGGSADTGAIVLNVASNMTGVNGSINNVMNEVNGSIGNLSTTALGAVNTGTIVSGVDAAVAGIVGSSAGQ
ncbi:hypothetical protein PXK17_20945 [Phaeobacter gallaeciensis]|uniref:Uncharacterized protein n=1 Tax=Phaeobacter gallaeciensis TaxID=60890 RepID=A0ABD4XFF6_9RHOB|nr:hypothetical protein [Phaeobacter gallaeciensis]MDE4147078.1 hypothetical protein [Phaeobacter gallaeciensis]MDE4159714.1 hypothetical protein [Phaeobacter gallaeciensis]MDE4163935.1 hypothetical protein [Phaeobacter gallaeciensis]MDE4168160.1 hypothetical protein [Phaeobacter gallaeciensis]MDE4172401.1 hypothetical protein [Phaeobacter gallaeciensis]